MLLQELFGHPSVSSWDIDGNYAEYHFTVGGLPYTVYMEKFNLDPEAVDAELSNYNFDLRMAGEIWSVEFSNNKAQDRYGVTNTGNVGEVFGNVIAALRLFKQSRPNAAFFFTAKEPSRRRLYDAIASRFSRSRQVQDSKYDGGLRAYLVM